MKKTLLIILAPVTVLIFVVILAVMYGWIGTIGTGQGEPPERPEMGVVNQKTFSAGMGTGQIQLINNPTFPSGIGNGQIQLINNPTFPSGIGNGQIQLINKPTFPAGVGKGQIQLINQPLKISYLGLDLGEVPGAVAQELKLPPETGVYIKNVLGASPAQKAGIKPGDVILKCDHQTIMTHERVGQIIRTKKVGDVIKVVVNRDGRKKSFHVKLEKAPKGLVQVAALQNNKIWMGAEVQDIDAVMKLQFSLPDKRGVIVSHVNANSPAMTTGLRTGDVIRRFNNTRTRDVKQFQSLILKSRPGKEVQLTVLRNRDHLTLTVIPEQRPVTAPKKVFIDPADIAIEGSWIGMDVGELSAGGASALGLPAGTRGIRVNDVESPPATMLGFMTGDLITAINGEPTPGMKQFQAATRKQSSAVVDVIRGNKHLFISVPPPGFTQQGTKLSQPLDNHLRKVAFTQPALAQPALTQPVFAQPVFAQPVFAQPVFAQPAYLPSTLPSTNGAKIRLGIFSSGPDLNAPVTGNTNHLPYLIMVDLSNDSYAVVEPDRLGNLEETFRQHHLSALVCSRVSQQTAAELSNLSIAIYTGVVGPSMTALNLYTSGCLTPSRGL